MNEHRPAPTGLGRRHHRLTDEETRDRMLHSAIEMINRTGLTVSLDHISFEDVIRDAGVARSTAYRHWPYKDLFFSDLVKELAATASPTIIRDEITLMRRVLNEHRDWLQTPQLRTSLLLELIRQLAQLDFQSILDSPGWRTYLALHAAFSSLSDGELREQVRSALAQAEEARTAQVARAWRQMAAHRTPASPFGAAGIQDWSLAAIGGASLAMAFLEPDPATTWDDDRLAEIHHALEAWER